MYFITAEFERLRPILKGPARSRSSTRQEIFNTRFYGRQKQIIASDDLSSSWASEKQKLAWENFACTATGQYNI